MKIDYKRLFKIIFFTFLVGSLFAIFTGNKAYDTLNKPFSLPGIVFPIVWSILYLIMSISYYRVTEISTVDKKDDLFLAYASQLIINSLWTLIFFGLKLYFLGFLWILLLIIFVISMIIKFYKVDKISGLINIPYLLWLLFASFLNLSIYLLN